MDSFNLRVTTASGSVYEIDTENRRYRTRGSTRGYRLLKNINRHGMTSPTDLWMAVESTPEAFKPEVGRAMYFERYSLLESWRLSTTVVSVEDV